MFALGIDASIMMKHLGDLRQALIRAALFLIVAAVTVYTFSEMLLANLLSHMPDGANGLVFLSPAEAFTTRIKLALGGGLVLSIPFLLFQVWTVTKPFLVRKQRKIALLMIPLAFMLFVVGAAFAYIMLLPIALRFLLSFSGPELEPMLAAAPFVSFVIMLVLPLGLVFQIPLITVFLTRLGILDPDSLGARRKYAILITFIVSAVLTPPDVFSQLLMAGPLIILFEVSLLVARIAGRNRSRPHNHSGIK